MDKPAYQRHSTHCSVWDDQSKRLFESVKVSMFKGFIRNREQQFKLVWLEEYINVGCGRNISRVWRHNGHSVLWGQVAEHNTIGEFFYFHKSELLRICSRNNSSLLPRFCYERGGVGELCAGCVHPEVWRPCACIALVRVDVHLCPDFAHVDVRVTILADQLSWSLADLVRNWCRNRKIADLTDILTVVRPLSWMRDPLRDARVDRPWTMWLWYVQFSC